MTEEEVKAAFVSAYNKLVTEKKEILANAEIIRRTLCKDGVIKDFDESLWGSMVDYVTVGRDRDKELIVTFRDGTEIEA